MDLSLEPCPPSLVLTKFLHEFPKITDFGKHTGVLVL